MGKFVSYSFFALAMTTVMIGVADYTYGWIGFVPAVHIYWQLIDTRCVASSNGTVVLLPKDFDVPAGNTTVLYDQLKEPKPRSFACAWNPCTAFPDGYNYTGRVYVCGTDIWESRYFHGIGPVFGSGWFDYYRGYLIGLLVPGAVFLLLAFLLLLLSCRMGCKGMSDALNEIEEHEMQDM